MTNKEKQLPLITIQIAISNGFEADFTMSINDAKIAAENFMLENQANFTVKEVEAEAYQWGYEWEDEFNLKHIVWGEYHEKLGERVLTETTVVGDVIHEIYIDRTDNSPLRPF